MIFEAFILAAGLSSRMGKSNKLLLKYKDDMSDWFKKYNKTWVNFINFTFFYIQ